MANLDKAAQTLAVLEEALADPSEWRDVPEAIKQAFRATHGLFKWQIEATAQLVVEVDRRVDKDDLKKVLKFKANVVDIEESMEKVSEAMEQKVSLEDLEGILGDFAMKKDMPAFDPQLEARIDKLEQMALNLEVDDKGSSAKHFATRAEMLALENAIQECAHVDDVRRISEEALTQEKLEIELKTKLGPELSQQIEDLQEYVKGQLGSFESHLNSRADIQEVLAVKRDIDRLMKQGALNSNQEISVLKNRVETLESANSMLKSDLKDISEVHKDLQVMLDKLVAELSGFVAVGKLEEFENKFSPTLHYLEGKVKVLENRDLKTQEVLEVLAQARLPEFNAEPAQSSGRNALKPETILEQMEHIKDYINKKLKKSESLLAPREDIRSLESKFEEFETQTNQIFETLKEMVRDLAHKLKSNSKSLEEKIEFRLKNPIYQQQVKVEEKTPSLATIAGSEYKVPGVGEKLKNLDNLIAKVAGMVEKKQVEEQDRTDLKARVVRLEETIKDKADKVKVSKLLDAKAGKLKLIKKSKM